MVSSLLVLLASRFLSFRRGSIWRSLFWAFSSHNCCHLFVIICLILCFKSVYGSLEVLSGGMLIAALATKSAFIISLDSHIAWNPAEYDFLLCLRAWSLFNRLTIRGLSSFWFFIECRTDMESECAKFIAQISAVNMEASLGRDCFIVLLFRTAP